jgi:hypothetical protein
MGAEIVECVNAVLGATEQEISATDIHTEHLPL